MGMDFPWYPSQQRQTQCTQALEQYSSTLGNRLGGSGSGGGGGGGGGGDTGEGVITIRVRDGRKYEVGAVASCNNKGHAVRGRVLLIVQVEPPPATAPFAATITIDTADTGDATSAPPPISSAGQSVARAAEGVTPLSPTLSSPPAASVPPLRATTDPYPPGGNNDDGGGDGGGDDGSAPGPQQHAATWDGGDPAQQLGSEQVQQLLALGATEEQALTSLSAAQGDVNIAASMILG